MGESSKRQTSTGPLTLLRCPTAAANPGWPVAPDAEQAQALVQKHQRRLRFGYMPGLERYAILQSQWRRLFHGRKI